jgi:2-C-methyl-D-erythritol 2,4-cyclodiphosphate synthase
MTFRTGIGYDVHRFEEGIPLFLGGIKIPYEKGLKGHSDADVLLHAICDALLGALALGDIGKYFPDNDEAFKGIDSKIILSRCFSLVKDRSFKIVNLDSILILEKPKVSEYITEMRKTIAGILETDIDNISVKATTTERLGFEGRGEGVAAQAVVIVVSGASAA